MRGKNDVIMLASLLFLPKSVAVSDKIISFALTDKSEFRRKPNAESNLLELC